MSPMLRLAVPMLAAAGSAYAACSASKTLTIQNSGDATALASCKTYTGSIAIQTDAAGSIAIDGVKKIEGNLVVNNNSALQEISADSLTEIDGDFSLTEVTALNSLSFPKLNTVKAFRWLGLPKLNEMGFTDSSGEGTGVTKASVVRIENTNLQALGGLDLLTVDEIFIANNPYISSIEMQLSNITNSLILTANNPDVEVSFVNLDHANNMTFRNCSSVKMPSLEELDDSLSLIGNTFTEFHAPNLTKIGGALAINSNYELTNLTFPVLTEVGANLEIQNNTDLRKIKGFPKLKTIYADLDFYGNMTDIELPSLSDVRGAFNIQSTNDIDKQCREDFDPLGKKLKGKYFCEGKLADPGDVDSTHTQSADSPKKTNAASSAQMQGGAMMAGLAAAFFL